MKSCEVLFYGEKDDFLAKSTSQPPFLKQKSTSQVAKSTSQVGGFTSQPWFLKQRLAHIPEDTHKKHPTGKSRRGVCVLSVKDCSTIKDYLKDGHLINKCLLGHLSKVGKCLLVGIRNLSENLPVKLNARKLKTMHKLAV